MTVHSSSAKETDDGKISISPVPLVSVGSIEMSAGTHVADLDKRIAHDVDEYPIW